MFRGVARSKGPEFWIPVLVAVMAGLLELIGWLPPITGAYR